MKTDEPDPPYYVLHAGGTVPVCSHCLNVYEGGACSYCGGYKQMELPSSPLMRTDGKPILLMSYEGELYVDATTHPTQGQRMAHLSPRHYHTWKDYRIEGYERCDFCGLVREVR